jgi:hypothetical protein
MIEKSRFSVSCFLDTMPLFQKSDLPPSALSIFGNNTTPSYFADRSVDRLRAIAGVQRISIDRF